MRKPIQSENKDEILSHLRKYNITHNEDDEIDVLKVNVILSPETFIIIIIIIIIIIAIVIYDYQYLT